MRSSNLFLCFVVVLGTCQGSARLLADENAGHSAEVSTAAEITGDEHSAAHDGHDGHAPNINPISADPDLAIVTAIVFLVLMAVLWKFAWGPISEALEKRERTIAENITEAQRQNEEARRLLAEHEAKLASAAVEVKQMLEDAKRDAEIQKQSILAEAQTAAAAEKDRAIREIENAKNSALQSLAERSVDTAVSLASKILRRQLSPEDKTQLIHEALNNLPSDN